MLFLFFLVTLLVTPAPGFAAEVSDDSESTTVLQKIADINMRSLPWKESGWDTDSYVEFIKIYRPMRLNPPPRQKRQNTFALFEKMESTLESPTNFLLNDESLWSDLELFCGKKNGQKFLANVIDRTITDYGKIKLYWVLAQPTNNVDLLRHRQNIIKTFNTNQDLTLACVKQLEILQKTETIFLSFWHLNDPFKHGIKRHYHCSIDSLNKSESFLLAQTLRKHVFNITGLSFAALATGTLACYSFARAANIDLPKWLASRKDEHQGAGGRELSYIWKKMESKWPSNRWLQAGIATVSAMVCAMSINSLIDDLHGCYLRNEFIHEIMHQVSQTIQALKSISKIIQQDPFLAVLDDFKPLQDLFLSKNTKVQEFLVLMESTTLTGNVSFFSHKGKVFHAFMLMHEVKNQLIQAINAAAELDVYVAFSKLYQESLIKRVQWCFADYVAADKPMINAVNFWHPVVDENIVIANSVQIGTESNPTNLVITGPNAGGKSTILKSLTISVLLAQTFGLVPAEQLSLTPFSSIATYLNITDDIGSGNSLYKAEVIRVVELMKRIKNLKPGQFSFALFDEVFNGTSPHEGSAAAYSVIDHLAQYENSINLVATHFSLLTKLSEKNNRVTNYKVTVTVHDDGRIEYPFKLYSGVSNQHVAIDILRNEGVSNTILEQAQSLLMDMNKP